MAGGHSARNILVGKLIQNHRALRHPPVLFGYAAVLEIGLDPSGFQQADPVGVGWCGLSKAHIFKLELGEADHLACGVVHLAGDWRLNGSGLEVLIQFGEFFLELVGVHLVWFLISDLILLIRTTAGISSGGRVGLQYLTKIAFLASGLAFTHAAE